MIDIHKVIMKRAKALKLLRDHRVEIATFGVKRLALFGSVARDMAQTDSDVDILVEFSHPVGLFQFIGLKQYLESLLGCPVDLGTSRSLKPYLKEEVLESAIYVS
jgi:predicted nucleotidyltransferase